MLALARRDGLAHDLVVARQLTVHEEIAVDELPEHRRAELGKVRMRERGKCALACICGAVRVPQLRRGVGERCCRRLGVACASAAERRALVLQKDLGVQFGMLLRITVVAQIELALGTVHRGGTLLAKLAHLVANRTTSGRQRRASG